eukprot:CAMPEP_0181349806 /NCGR_PEP_ID=MMETSP1106-20121128/926_1 /TAXON_ID=81844 /ORGANISM="Mantoniella antarctica, Strain SL-175" /LENGTH=122 /DNA_ID=CAMNT_0023462231 /DNA_START=799 /DNA_END=1168 /DNA_ORIENTATION=-
MPIPWLPNPEGPSDPPRAAPACSPPALLLHPCPTSSPTATQLCYGQQYFRYVLESILPATRDACSLTARTAAASTSIPFSASFAKPYGVTDMSKKTPASFASFSLMYSLRFSGEPSELANSK